MVASLVVALLLSGCITGSPSEALRSEGEGSGTAGSASPFRLTTGTALDFHYNATGEWDVFRVHIANHGRLYLNFTKPLFVNDETDHVSTVSALRWVAVFREPTLVGLGPRGDVATIAHINFTHDHSWQFYEHGHMVPYGYDVFAGQVVFLLVFDSDVSGAFTVSLGEEPVRRERHETVLRQTTAVSDHLMPEHLQVGDVHNYQWEAAPRDAEEFLFHYGTMNIWRDPPTVNLQLHGRTTDGRAGLCWNPNQLGSPAIVNVDTAHVWTFGWYGYDTLVPGSDDGLCAYARYGTFGPFDGSRVIFSVNTVRLPLASIAEAADAT